MWKSEFLLLEYVVKYLKTYLTMSLSKFVFYFIRKGVKSGRNQYKHHLHVENVNGCAGIISESPEKNRMANKRCHDLPKRTGMDRNGPKQTETDRNGPKRTYENTETDFYRYRNGPERTSVGTETDFSSYRNELQWKPEKLGWGTIGTILIKLCMYW